MYLPCVPDSHLLIGYESSLVSTCRYSTVGTGTYFPLYKFILPTNEANKTKYKVGTLFESGNDPDRCIRKCKDSGSSSKFYGYKRPGLALNKILLS